MNGREFVAELELRGFVIKRRCRSFVWIGREEQVLMLDEEATVPEKFSKGVLGQRHSRPPVSVRRPSLAPRSRPSGRPSRRP